MTENGMTRRGFLATASVGAAAVSALGQSARAALGANERIGIGIIGTGGRGLGTLIPQIVALQEKYNVAVVAVCDVWKPNLEAAVKRVAKAFGKEPARHTRFQDVLAMAEVDAVMIATPDFSHTPIMIEALKAGKDVYVEKPMSLDIGEANEALDLARKHERVVQVGTQNRSNGVYWAARDEVASGSLGKIVRVTASRNFNEPRWARGFEDCKAADVDWDAFLLNRSSRPFDPRLLRRWHLYKEFTNGLSGLWGCHYVDAMHIITGAKHPRSATAHGGIYLWNDGREHTDTFHGLWDYPEGFFFDWAMSLTNSAGLHWRVHGTQGTLEAKSGELGTSAWLVSSAGGIKGSKVEERVIEGQKNPYATGDMVRDHVANWLDCIRTRQRPLGDIEYGHQHSVTTIMAAAALETGRRQGYDPRKREMKAV